MTKAKIQAKSKSDEAPAKKTQKTKSSKNTPSKKSEKEKWDDVLKLQQNAKNSETGNGDCRAYSMKMSYQSGELIQHQAFGVGHVEAAANGKMYVRFEDKVRILAFNRV